MIKLVIAKGAKSESDQKQGKAEGGQFFVVWLISVMQLLKSSKANFWGLDVAALGRPSF
ncbi:hypothetical protein [Aeromonas hydrophila]|uniref:hypothetical protein n=1 Tax=Aeromonas hydrophila TaxID=644 RepID=UPI002B4A82A7|nr:hypothetical protein [Aeromonas hydrophila]